MRRRGHLGLAGLTLLAAALLGCHRGAAESVDTSNAVPVQVVAARRGAIRAVVRASGVVSAAPGAELVVVAPAPARVAAVPHNEGERVARGGLLVRFEAPNLEADAAARRADLERGKAHVAAATAELDRLTQLFERGIAAKREVEAARKELADAHGEMETARTALAAASTLAGRTVVTAPFDGVVTSRLHNPGDLVDAATADPVLRFVDPLRLQVEAAVPLTDLAAVAIGQPARVLGPSSVLVGRGTVVGHAAAADPATSAGKVRIALGEATLLPANSPVQVEILTVEHPSAVVIPAAAVVQEGPRSFVYVVTPDQHAHRREVQLGIATATEVEVATGVAAGDLVVVEGENGLPDDAQVAVTRAAAGVESAKGPGGSGAR